MIQLSEYILKSLLCGLVFWSLFKLIGEKLLTFGFQRRYILFASLFTLIFPFVRIPFISSFFSRGENVFSIDLPALIFRGDGSGLENISPVEDLISGDAGYILPLFITVSILYLLYTLLQLAIIFFLRKKGEVYCLDGLEVIVNPRVRSPFSFFRFIFLSPGISDREREQIICHESSHIRRGHSLDILLISAIKIFQWFNPFIFLLGKSLSSLHEYQADRDVLGKGYRLEDYQLLILSLQLGISPLIANRLNGSLTIKRLLKMKKSVKMKNSVPGMILLSAGTLILLFLISVTGNSCRRIIEKEKLTPVTEKAKKADTSAPQTQSIAIVDEDEVVTFTLVEKKTEAKEEKTAVKEDKAGAIDEVIPIKEDKAGAIEVKTAAKEEEIPFMVVDVKPKFMGGDDAKFTKWVYERLQYPEMAKVKGIQGRILLTFIVSKDGSVKDVRVVRGVDKSLDEEALRVVSASPKWTPGMEKGEAVNVRFQFPIIFQLR
ncbi:MAG: M56 family metallopeptidase [Bacteroidales bacterium]|nr:M56 family metallopeptidase [Bacteroidales bacterium]MDD2425033.1 M56 family metallopeptidase [Bacteroidales bacterium]MDD3989326.1 M56 family metallopeptidase [Bacteroidales bacterium]MDD4638665.1 M56 family metallopeptidase [Bacteroidales bacterium]